MLYWSGGRDVGVGIICCWLLIGVIEIHVPFVVVINVTNILIYYTTNMFAVPCYQCYQYDCCYLLMLLLMLSAAIIGVAFIGVVKVPLLL